MHLRQGRMRETMRGEEEVIGKARVIRDIQMGLPLPVLPSMMPHYGAKGKQPHLTSVAKKGLLPGFPHVAQVQQEQEVQEEEEADKEHHAEAQDAQAHWQDHAVAEEDAHQPECINKFVLMRLVPRLALKAFTEFILDN